MHDERALTRGCRKWSTERKMFSVGDPQEDTIVRLLYNTVKPLELQELAQSGKTSYREKMS